MRYQITVIHASKQQEVFTTQDRNALEASRSVAMLEDCFPDAKVELNDLKAWPYSEKQAQALTPTVKSA